MDLKDEQTIVSLLDKDPELKKFYDEHRELEKQLAEFQHKHHLSPEEEVEMKKIQKLKLAGKDRMMEILEKHRHSGAVAL
ncbi:MAG TPA: DUF465 domain-containing protein [Candidatus Binatia bacterium]|jgi:hypothetical protein|nr:DUF465 domain-containing protein [Candidatus Binatia bacterium]